MTSRRGIDSVLGLEVFILTWGCNDSRRLDRGQVAFG
jgi:hypothetical protein